MGEKALENEITDTSGFERGGWLEIFELKENAAVQSSAEAFYH